MKVFKLLINLCCELSMLYTGMSTLYLSHNNLFCKYLAHFEFVLKILPQIKCLINTY